MNRLFSFGSAALLALAFDTLAQGTNPLRITCPANQTHWVCGRSSTVLVTYPPPTTAGGNCSFAPVVTCTPPSGALFTLGTTTVTCSATSRCGEGATCTFAVTVARDTIPPVIQCPANLSVMTCSTSGTVVNFPLPTATDNADPNVVVTCAPPSGSLFPVGTTIVTCTATDDCTNRSVCSFTVTVHAPVLYHGLCHSALGLAALNINTDDELEVSGFGASGQDGVRIELGESQGLGFSYRNAANLTAGEVEVQILGQDTTGQEIVATRMLQHYEDGKLSVTPSFANYQVKLLLRGEMVYRRSATSDFNPVIFCTPVQNAHCVPDVHVPGFFWISGCWTFITIECTSETDAGPVVADTMVITPEEPGPWITAETAVQIFGRNIPGITLEQEHLLMLGGR